MKEQEAAPSAPRACADAWTPGSYSIDTHAVALMLQEPQYKRAVRKGLRKIAARWKIHL
jgi:hypothetical protein